jgi:hypothetical protein
MMKCSQLTHFLGGCRVAKGLPFQVEKLKSIDVRIGGYKEELRAQNDEVRTSFACPLTRKNWQDWVGEMSERRAEDKEVALNRPKRAWTVSHEWLRWVICSWRIPLQPSSQSVFHSIGRSQKITKTELRPSKIRDPPGIGHCDAMDHVSQLYRLSYQIQVERVIWNN